jgi:hypothetical protein
MILATRVTNRKRSSTSDSWLIVVLRVEVENKNEVLWLAAASLRDSYEVRTASHFYNLARRNG